MSGICLAAQHLKNLIRQGKIVGPAIKEDQIQPASFEPTLGSEVFILDTETKGVFRPQADEPIMQTLLKIPERQRKRIDISQGFEIKKGFTYLFPLNERVILGLDEYIKSSTKSSFGRLFLNTRLLGDYHPCFDELSHSYKANTELHLWLLVQPLTFNMVVYPGIRVNQLRFFQGYDAQLTPSQIIESFKTNPFLFIQKDNGLVPAEPIVIDGLQIHIDLSGKHTKGIKAFRARHNPLPIDLNKIREYEAEHYFEPILGGDDSIALIKGEHYLLVSKEHFKLPANLNAELKSHSHISIRGPLHFAGFIDNGFEGHLVLEVRSDEISNMVLTDGMPISKIDLFRTENTEKLYGTEIGSNYHKQTGIRLSKYFKTAF